MDLCQYTLNGNADAVEFCPWHPHRDILAAATYTLKEGIQPERNGSISLFSDCELIYCKETAGVFDIKWCPEKLDAHPILAQAGADGCLSLYSLEPTCETDAAPGVMLIDLSANKLSSSMCLSLDWSSSGTSISVGLSDGSISLVNIAESEIRPTKVWTAHEYEVWYTAFDLHQPQLLYTGSDDCKFCCWDTRRSHLRPVFQNSKSHKMGVCCIAKSPSNPNIVLTGSYDESLREWDIRTLSRPVNQSSVELGGGVWRIKHHPDDPGLVLAACMHNGFAIVRMTSEGFQVVERYEKHDSLAYGADWRKGVYNRNGGSGSLVATCSFYDRQLRFWLPESLLIK